MKAARLILALLVAFAWLGIAGVGGMTFGKLSEVTSNDQATFLPATAESTLASEFVREFQDSEEIPALVVAELDQKFSDSQMREFGEAVEVLQSIDGVADVIGPIPAEDQEAVQYIALIDTAQYETAEVVAQLRASSADGFGVGAFADADLHVGGPGGFSSDLAGAFAGIDGILLAVALIVVLIILVVVYRSVLLPLLVITTAMVALTASVLVVYSLAKADVIQLNGQAQGILSILVIGAATDYGLLLVARHREELIRNETPWQAVRAAVRGSFGAITASASTVAVALLCLLVSDLNSNRSLGPIAAVGIVFAWLAALTMLPALLSIFGRAAFWPAKPRFDADVAHPDGTGLWVKITQFVSARPRKVWVGTLLVLLLGAAFVPTLKADGVSQSDVIFGDTDAKQAQGIINDHFADGAGSPTTVIMPENQAQQALELLGTHDGVDSATLTAASGGPADTPPANEPPKTLDGKVLIQATLADQPDSAAAETTVKSLRTELRSLDSSALVGGATATAIDSNETAIRDLTLIIPIVLVVVWVILIVLLRAVLLPTLLIAATVVSFGTAMGVSALVFNHVFGFSGADPSVPLYGFVFLVALGIDYTIFLMTRAREETLHIGTREGVQKALTVTGGVITSAGVVLAATFAALAVIPLMFMLQLAFIVAFGVLIDTLIVRTLLVPGLVLDIGPAVWWPFTKRTEPQK